MRIGGQSVKGYSRSTPWDLTRPDRLISMFERSPADVGSSFWKVTAHHDDISLQPITTRHKGQRAGLPLFAVSEGAGAHAPL